MKPSLRTLFLAVLLGVFAAPGVSAQPFKRGPLDQEERTFLRVLIFEYGYTDLARVWIEERKRSVSGTALGDLLYAEADCLQVDASRVNDRELRERKLRELEETLSRLTRRYPNHPRTPAAVLQTVRARMAAVIAKFNEAAQETDATRRAEIEKERDRIFQDEVIEPVEKMITQLNDQVTGLQEKIDAAVRKRERDEAAEREMQEVAPVRDAWEHYRVEAWQLYAESLPTGSAQARQAFEKVLEHADFFVSERFLSYGFAYDCQLRKAQALSALGKPEEAAEEFELLVELEPDFDGPYSPAVEKAFRQFRIQGAAGTARAWLRAGKPEAAVEVFDLVRDNQNPYLPYRKDPEDADMLPIVILAEIEEAVARIAGGSGDRGLAIFRRLLADNARLRRSDPVSADRFDAEVAEGLSRLLDYGAGGLRAELYYRAGLGYKSRFRFDDALDASRRAVAAGRGIGSDAVWVAKALYEIGENSFLLDDPQEAAVTYLILLEHFPEAPESANAAQNAFALLADLASEGPAWKSLAERAQLLFSQRGEGVQAERLKLQQAAKREESADYDGARQIYLSVEKQIEKDGETRVVPFYFSARAAAANCLFRDGVSKGEADAAREQAVAELEALIAQAEKEDDAAGRAALHYQLAQIYWDASGRDGARASAALEPFATDLSGKSDVRRSALYLWIQILLAEGDLAGAEEKRELMRRDFSSSLAFANATLLMIEQYGERGTPQARRRAAELAKEYAQHPEVRLAEQGPGKMLWLGVILIAGGLDDEGARILADAESSAVASGDEDLLLAVQLAFVRAANRLGNHREALAKLEELLTRYESEIRSGVFVEADTILSEAATAHIGLHQESPSLEDLEKAEGYLSRAINTVDLRRRAQPRGEKDPDLENNYWGLWIRLLKVWEAMEKKENVVKTIQTFRVSVGGQRAFAPELLQVEFDKIEERCRN